MLDLWPSAISKNLGFGPDSEKIDRLPSNPYTDSKSVFSDCQTLINV